MDCHLIAFSTRYGCYGHGNLQQLLAGCTREGASVDDVGAALQTTFSGGGIGQLLSLEHGRSGCMELAGKFRRFEGCCRGCPATHRMNWWQGYPIIHHSDRGRRTDCARSAAGGCLHRHIIIVKGSENELAALLILGKGLLKLG